MGSRKRRRDRTKVRSHQGFRLLPRQGGVPSFRKDVRTLLSKGRAAQGKKREAKADPTFPAAVRRNRSLGDGTATGTPGGSQGPSGRSEGNLREGASSSTGTRKGPDRSSNASAGTRTERGGQRCPPGTRTGSRRSSDVSDGTRNAQPKMRVAPRGSARRRDSGGWRKRQPPFRMCSIKPCKRLRTGGAGPKRLSPDRADCPLSD